MYSTALSLSRPAIPLSPLGSILWEVICEMFWFWSEQFKFEYCHATEERKGRQKSFLDVRHLTFLSWHSFYWFIVVLLCSECVVIENSSKGLSSILTAGYAEWSVATLCEKQCKLLVANKAQKHMKRQKIYFKNVFFCSWILWMIEESCIKSVLFMNSEYPNWPMRIIRPIHCKSSCCLIC